MTKLHVFDMDGTLLRGNSVEEISRYFGRFEEARALENSYLKGEADDSDGAQWWARVFALWADADDEELDAAFDNAPWMERISEVFADITARGEHSVVISQSPIFIVRRLERWGVHASFATTVEPGVPGTADQLLTARHKAEITARLIAKFALTKADCVAYGDSTSDVELFEMLVHTLAVNADPRIRSMAAEAYDGTDLWDAYQIGRKMLNTNTFRWNGIGDDVSMTFSPRS